MWNMRNNYRKLSVVRQLYLKDEWRRRMCCSPPLVFWQILHWHDWFYWAEAKQEPPKRIIVSPLMELVLPYPIYQLNNIRQDLRVYHQLFINDGDLWYFYLQSTLMERVLRIAPLQDIRLLRCFGLWCPPRKLFIVLR